MLDHETFGSHRNHAFVTRPQVLMFRTEKCRFARKLRAILVTDAQNPSHPYIHCIVDRKSNRNLSDRRCRIVVPCAEPMIHRSSMRSVFTLALANNLIISL
jgi:hypothetical protein